jgi:hypothetical protein
LGEYLEIVDAQYQISDEGLGKLPVKLKAKAQAPEGFTKSNNFELSLSLLDQDGLPVSGTEDFSLDYSAKNKIKSLLDNSSKEEVVLFIGRLGGYHADKDAARAKKFSMSSTVTENKPATSSNSSANETIVSDAGSNTDWDKLLNDYEAYVDDYVKFYKKALNGDQSAVAEYPAMLEKAEKFEKSLKEAKKNNNLSAKQVTRMIKIQNKMLAMMSAK